MAGSHRKHPPIPLIIVVLLAVIGGGYWVWTASRTSADAASLSASGEMEAREYQIASAIAGRVTNVRVAEGDTVKKGQELVLLDRTALQLQREQAEQGVIAAKAAVANAEDDGTDADVTAAKARLKQAQAAVKLADVQLGYARVTAPRDGVVVSVITNVGQNSAPGKTLVTVLDPSDLFVRVFVPETEIGNVAVGQAVTVTTDSSSDRFDGQVTFIAAKAEFTPNNVQTEEQRAKLVYEVRVKVPDDSGTLKSGMPVDVTFARP
ncbi:MAG: efflux RND transporter periplasmic adaptor subunit [Candidatus Nanopelagicales bacterium]